VRAIGGPVYFELQVDEPARAIAFWSGVFNWSITQDEGLVGEYWRVETDGISGGLVHRPAPAPPPRSGTNAAVVSMRVTSFDATAARILAAGGVVALPKFAVPGRCWQGYFIDPEGNTFGIFEADPNAALPR
jgi:predicted enzyme related to lactoylglutathione lyase